MPQQTVSREERLARQERDDGAPDDDVYRKRSHPIRVYHDDRDCHILVQSPGEPKTETRAAAQRAWRAPCRWCVLGETFGGWPSG